MGGNKNKTKEASGSDPRGTNQNQINQQVEAYQSQQRPLAEEMGYNYARGAEANYGDYTDIMNQYRGIASGAGGAGGGGGGGGGEGYTAQTWNPELIKYNDPFTSYTGFQEFSNTGGYSPADINNMRARGVSPIRAAYGNAEREVGRQRSLQGGYSPNAFALQGRMAREQGQLGADAVQNVEAGIAEARNKGRLSGLTGMTDIEKQRLAGDLKVQEYNADAKTAAAQANAAAANAAASQGASSRDAASRASRNDQFEALAGMRALYGTTPAMASKFGDQAIEIVGQGGTFGNNVINSQVAATQAPGQYEQTMGRLNSGIKTGQEIANMTGTVINGINQYKKQQPIAPTNVGTTTGPNYGQTGATGGEYDPYEAERRARRQ